jgi:hypothetical protein
MYQPQQQSLTVGPGQNLVPLGPGQFYDLAANTTRGSMQVNPAGPVQPSTNPTQLKLRSFEAGRSLWT